MTQNIQPTPSVEAKTISTEVDETSMAIQLLHLWSEHSINHPRLEKAFNCWSVSKKGRYRLY